MLPKPIFFTEKNEFELKFSVKFLLVRLHKDSQFNKENGIRRYFFFCLLPFSYA